MEALKKVVDVVDIEIKKLTDSIDIQISELQTIMSKKIKNEKVYRETLNKRLSFLEWVNKSWKLRFESKPSVVKQKEVFYCELGETIGSEQGLNRPVIILQNNIGNSFGDTTIIVPITTYEDSSFYKKDGRMYIKYIKDSKIIERPLYFYEIPVDVTSESVKKIHGIANVVHMREISQKRLKTNPVAVITDGTYNNIVKAISKNISEF